MNIATTKGQPKSLSLPNILTYARIAAIPVVVIAFSPDPSWTAALAALGGAGRLYRRGVTDYLDWLLCANLGSAIRFGRMLDPIADKLWWRPAC
jgi:cardiolipin synthase